jgi:hypothetical protein
MNMTVLSRADLCRLRRWMSRHGWERTSTLDDGTELWHHTETKADVRLPAQKSKQNQYLLDFPTLPRIKKAARMFLLRELINSVAPGSSLRHSWRRENEREYIRRHVDHLKRHPRDHKAWQRLRDIIDGRRCMARWGSRESRRIAKEERYEVRKSIYEHPRVKKISRLPVGHLMIATDYLFPDGDALDLYIHHRVPHELTDLGNTSGWLSSTSISGYEALLADHLSDVEGVDLIGSVFIARIGENVSDTITRLGEACVSAAMGAFLSLRTT